MGLDIQDSNLMSRFWLSTDFQQIKSDYDAARTANVNPETHVIGAEMGIAKVGETAVTVEAKNRGLSLLSEQSGNARYKEVFGRAKLLGARAADPNGLRQKALNLGLPNLDRLAADLATMNVRQQVDGEGKRLTRAATDEEVAAAKDVLAALLQSEEVEQRAARHEPLSRGGVLALLNAGLGCLKLIRDGEATGESLFELVRGDVYDLTQPADVLKLSVKTAQKARELFIAKDQVNDCVERAIAAIEHSVLSPEAKTLQCERVRNLGNDIIAARERLAAGLDIPYDLGDGKKTTIETKIKDARRAMRAFRYDLDRMNNVKMGTMEGFRRRMDNLFRSAPTLTRASFAEVHELEGRLNFMLRRENVTGADGQALSLAFSDSAEHCRTATNVTHTANNRIRYYFSGKEQKIEAFRQAAHAALDDLVAKGGSRSLQFEVGADAKFDTGVIGAKATVGAKYLQTATVSVAPGGGEVTVTYSHGGALYGQAEAGFGLSGGENADMWSDADRDSRSVVGGKVGVKGDLHASRTHTEKFRSLEDFIASLGGESSLVSRNAYTTMACCGKIGNFFKNVGRRLTAFATWTGLRIPKSREDNAAYQQQMRKLGIFATADRLIGHRENAIRTQNGSSWTAGGQAGINASLDIGHFNGTVISEKDGEEKAVKSSIFGLGGSLTGGVDRTFAREDKNYRTALDAARSHTTDWLASTAGTWYNGLAVPAGETRAQAALRALEADAQQLEDRLVQKGTDNAEALRTFAEGWGVLTTCLAYIERQNPDLDTAAFTERFTNPHVAIPSDKYDELLQEVSNVAKTGSWKVSAAFTLNWSVGGGLLDELSDNHAEAATKGMKLDPDAAFGGLVQGELAAAESTVLNGGLGTLVPTDCTLKGAYTYTKPVAQKNVCAWNNAATHAISIGLTPGLTTRALIEGLARKYVDTLTDARDEKTKAQIAKEAALDFWGTFQESFGISSAENVLGTTLDELAKIAPKLARFLKAPISGVTTGLEMGVDTSYNKAMNFNITGGRLTAITVDETTSIGSSVGVRVEIAGVVGVGAHVKETLTTNEVDRTALVRPSFDGLMGQAEPYLRMGDAEGLKALLTHNAPGCLRALAVLRSLPQDVAPDKYFEGDRRAFQLRKSEAQRLMSHLADRGTVDQQDRARQLLHRLAEADQLLAQANEVDDAARLDTLQKVVSTYSDAFTFARGTGLFSRDEATGQLDPFRVPNA